MENIKSIISFSEKLNKDTNEVLAKFEELRKEISKIPAASLTGKKLKKSINDYLNSSISVLLVLSDYCFEISSCDTESDLEFLLESSKNFENENIVVIEE